MINIAKLRKGAKRNHYLVNKEFLFGMSRHKLMARYCYGIQPTKLQA